MAETWTSGTRGTRAWGLFASAILLAGTLAACSSPNTTPGGSSTQASAPAPVFFLGEEFSGTRRATRAVVDAGTIWLLDDNGDFVKGTQPSDNWNADTGLTLAWGKVTGAANYHVMARNTVTPPTSWSELVVVPAPDPNLSPTVVQSGINPWKAGLGTGGYPWSFGNHVQFAVWAEDAKTNVIEDGITASLDTADEFPGLITSVAVDDPGLSAPFAPRLERGMTFAKSIRVTFSEPMRTDAIPSLTPMSDNVRIDQVTAVAFGSDPSSPSFAPTSVASNAFVALQLSVKGVCTELLYPRSQWDTILEVRDASPFASGTTARVLFLDAVTGAFYGEAENVKTVDVPLNRITLQNPLLAFNVIEVPAGALACALSGGAVSVPQFDSANGTIVNVNDASLFFAGEKVAVYLDPLSAGTGAIDDIRTVIRVDTTSNPNAVELSEAPSTGHIQGSSYVLPLNGVGGDLCTPLLAPGSEGDGFIQVRDVSLFSPGQDTEILFLDASTAAFIGTTTNVSAVSAQLSQVSIASPGLQVELPAGALACALSGGAVHAPQFVSASGARVAVSDATPFFGGENVAVYLDAQYAGTTAPIEDVRTVLAVNVNSKTITLSAAPSSGHTANSVVLPLETRGGEVALRPSLPLTLLADADADPTSLNVMLTVAAPAGVMVGDTVILDGDGDLLTTSDQFQGKVIGLGFGPSGSATVTVKVPPAASSLLLIHGRSKAIGAGDSFQVGGTRDTSAAAPTPLDSHADQCSPDGFLY